MRRLALPPGVRALRSGLGRGLGLVPKLVAALLVVALAAGAYAFWPRGEKVTVTGEFSRAVGLFPGSDVRILGVKVGTVLAVRPAGDKVSVTFEYDDQYRVPATAKAAVVAPSLVSDRYVQLYPAYTSGPRLRSGATIGLDRTAVPVELDRISQSLDDLLVALGPDGANRNGALQAALATGARNLQGNGTNIHDLNRDLSQAVTTLSGGRDDLFATVRNLQTFTSMLATNDAQVRRLNTDLAQVSTQLEGERGDLAAALKNLAVALNEVSTFVRDNRSLLKSDVAQLTQITGTVAKHRDALAETLTNAPVAISNLQNAYNPKSGTLDTRNNMQGLGSPTDILCSLLKGADGKDTTGLCAQLTTLLKPLGPLLGGLTGGGVTLPGGVLSAVPGGATPSSAGFTLGAADPTLGGLLEETR